MGARDQQAARADAGSREPVILCRHIKKTYTEGPREVEVLTDINLEVLPGERLAIVGSSGSGKTTLLNLLGGLDAPTAGEVIVAGRDAARLNETERGELRNRYLGFVYQFHHLLGEFTALENVAMPLLIARQEVAESQSRAREMLTRVGLGDRLDHKPSELSGGERQRVAIARALVTRPRCVLLDEPTGNLDRHTAREVQKLMLELNRSLATSFIVVTHDEELASSMDRILLLRDGKLHENE
jgi:lipoprotein-releasing system ATP-binding protein